nr:immunoglobulin light chain junction region [Macaca mulatta]MOY01611.1 immunoglobulin light chain junction region [Macaca mulatta]MOY02197.1 immunoglobulin light chain junction region [Macaca mulatta]
CMQHKAIPLTF